MQKIPSKIWYGSVALVALGVFGYVYMHSDFFPAPLKATLKNAEEIVREKITNISKEISSPGPLWGEKKELNSVLSTDGIWLYTNTAREEHSEESPLLRNESLDQIALIRANDMFEKQYFEHVSPTGESASDAAAEVGYEYIAIGENIALGNFENDAALVQAWMDSPGHRENIVSSKYTEIGIAAKKGLYDGDEIWIAVQIFGRPLSDCTEPSIHLKQRIEKSEQKVETLKSEADALYTTLQTGGKSPQEYNTTVEKYNKVVQQVNAAITETKALVSQYNNQVKLFNVCLEN